MGLASIAVTILVIAMAIGLVPDPVALNRAHRVQWCESLALGVAGFHSNADVVLIQEYFAAQQSRKSDVMSLGLRNHADRLVAATDHHETYWRKVQGSMDGLAFPLHQDGQLWATVEIVFRGSPFSGGWKSFVFHPWTLLTVLLSSASFVGFYLYLGLTLRQLDPSQTVPSRVRSALDNLTEGLLVIDRRKRIVLANSAFASYLDLEQDKLLGKSAHEFGWQTADGQPVTDFPWDRALAKSEVIVKQELQLVRPGRSTLIFHVNCSPIGKNQLAQGVMISFEDVTLLEQNKRDLSLAKSAAEDASRAKSTFLANMSHEIRTPMNAILGFTELLLRGEVTEPAEQQDYLGTVHRSGTHLLELINDILDLSKIEANKLDIDKAPFSPFDIVHDVVTVLGIRAKQKDITLLSHMATKLPEHVVSDGGRFRQIITNLIGNAIKFTEQGEVLVEMSVNESAGQYWLSVRIADTGIGMSPEQVARLFQPFSQADASITRRFGGTGLGLSISKRLAEAMGGSLTVVSEWGKGSLFTVNIPVGSLADVPWRTSNELLAARQRAAEPSTAISGRLPPANVLVVDDGEPNRRLARLILTRAGCRVAEATNGQEAIDILAQQQFHLVLMDMQMPVLDGLQATSRLRAQGVKTPIVALTANAMLEDRARCLEAGCSEFLPKPIQVDQLLNMTSQFIVPNFPDWVPPKAVPAASHRPLTTSKLTTDREVFDDAVVCELDLQDPDLFDIARSFVRELTKRWTNTGLWLERAHWNGLAEFAHWLKGAGGTCGFPLFSELGKQLERSVQVQQVELTRQLLNRIQTLTKRTEKSLEKSALVCH